MGVILQPDRTESYFKWQTVKQSMVLKFGFLWGMTSEGNRITYGAAISSCEMLAEFPAREGGSEREIRQSVVWKSVIVSQSR